MGWVVAHPNPGVAPPHIIVILFEKFVYVWFNKY